MPDRNLARERRYQLLLIWFGVVVALGIVVMVAVNMHRTALRETERAFIRNLRYQAESTGKSVRLVMDRVANEMILLTQLSVVREWRPKGVEFAFRVFMEQSVGKITHLALLDGSGEIKLLVTSTADIPADPIREQMEEFFQGSVGVLKLSLSERFGIPGRFRGIGVGVPIWQSDTKAGDETKGSSIYQTGMLIAILGTRELAASLLDPVRVGDDGFAFLSTGSTDPVVNEEKFSDLTARVYGFLARPSRFADDLQRAGEGEQLPGWDSVDSHVTRINRGYETWYLSTQRLDFSGRSWEVTVAAPESEMTRILDTALRQSALLLMVVVAILVGGAFLLTRATRRWAVAEEKALHAAELEEKNRDLEELNRRMDDFVSIVSHDIRSPLNVIRGFVKLIQTDPAGERFERETTTMLRSCNRLMQLVNDILDVKKLEAGRVALSYDPLVLEELVREGVMTMEFAAREKGQTIRQELSGATRLEGDAGKLLQVVNNLLANAIKFTPRGGAITVTVREEGEMAVLKVADTGPGIPKELQPAVFDKFEQVTRHQQGVEPGSGLGLTICRYVAALHGGSIGVDSVPGAGSTFTVTLPRSRPAHPVSTGM